MIPPIKTYKAARFTIRADVQRKQIYCTDLVPRKADDDSQHVLM